MKCDCFVQERLEQEEELKVKEAELLRGNPLLNNPASFNVKRRFESQYFPSKPKWLLLLLTLLVFVMISFFWGFCMHLFGLGGMMMSCLRTKPVVKPRHRSDSLMIPSGMISTGNSCTNTWNEPCLWNPSWRNLLICSLFVSICMIHCWWIYR